MFAATQSNNLTVVKAVTADTMGAYTYIFLKYEDGSWCFFSPSRRLIPASVTPDSLPLPEDEVVYRNPLVKVRKVPCNEYSNRSCWVVTSDVFDINWKNALHWTNYEAALHHAQNLVNNHLKQIGTQS